MLFDSLNTIFVQRDFILMCIYTILTDILCNHLKFTNSIFLEVLHCLDQFAPHSPHFISKVVLENMNIKLCCRYCGGACHGKPS